MFDWKMNNSDLSSSESDFPDGDLACCGLFYHVIFLNAVITPLVTSICNAYVMPDSHLWHKDITGRRRNLEKYTLYQHLEEQQANININDEGRKVKTSCVAMSFVWTWLSRKIDRRMGRAAKRLPVLPRCGRGEGRLQYSISYVARSTSTAIFLIIKTNSLKLII